jgi:hypothetical protein
MGFRWSERWFDEIVGGGRVMGIHGEFSGCLKMKFHQFIEMEQSIIRVI